MSEQLETARLDVGATRPAMLVGALPFKTCLWTGISYLIVERFFGWRILLMVAPPSALAIGVMIWRDYNAMRLWGIWAQTKAWVIDAWHHGGAAVSPFPIRTPKWKRRARGVSSDAW